MKRVLAAIPVDARPAVRSQVREMVACSGWELRMPPKPLLGRLRTAGDRDALRHWLLEQAPQVDGFVISLDMLVYGGLVPSRFIEDEAQALLDRLKVLHQLRRQAPHKPIHAFAATMRISNNNVAEEEKPYWAEYGARLWSWSHHQDRAQQAARQDQAAQSLQEVRRLELEIPAAIRTDYLMTRQRNLQVTQHALEAVRAGVITRLVLPQDDTAEFGLNVAERRHLQREVQRLGVDDRVAIYAGADEVMHTLCARLVAQLERRDPLRIGLLPSDPQALSALRARYEDRPLGESVAAQITAVGARWVGESDEADVMLAVHTQGTEQGDWAMGIALSQRTGVSRAWVQALHDARDRGRVLALADVAYANGGDPDLLECGLPMPDAYAGWNTASNTLGSVLSQCVLGAGRLQDEPARRALSLRLLEDQLYQARLRQVLRAQVDESRCTPQTLLQTARDIVLPASRDFARAHGLSHCAADLSLPWGRSFEIDLQLEALA
ncbi:MAG: DUF4127 family protein [Betaproteobacteria bacterium]|jgi:Protein of unknown function (DUF4127)|nr:DUF4127 family protein [Betaproteobacteria bacterium]NBX97096.1 DUF4127 family protein [Betaproteobacteria bacterium]